jgi:hypothetical protein
MKKGNFKAVFSTLLLGILSALPVYSDSGTVEMASRILDNFEGTAYVVDGEEYHYDWKAVASKLTTKTASQTFPIVNSRVSTAPMALQRLASEAGSEAKSLGVQGSFDRPGYNWIDVYPTIEGGDGQAVEIPLLGRTRVIDMWVWGSNLNYSIEAYIRDTKGVMHVIPMGSLRYVGWKNLRSNVPESIPMVSNVVPRSTHASTFVKLRVWADPKERSYVDVIRDGQGKIASIIPFYIYIDQIKVLADIYETIYDGDILANPRIVKGLWNGTPTGAPAN